MYPQETRYHSMMGVKPDDMEIRDACAETELNESGQDGGNPGWRYRICSKIAPFPTTIKPSIAESWYVSLSIHGAQKLGNYLPQC